MSGRVDNDSRHIITVVPIADLNLPSCVFCIFDGVRRYSADECNVDTGRKSGKFDLYDKKLSESIHDVHKKFHEITVLENISAVGKCIR